MKVIFAKFYALQITFVIVVTTKQLYGDQFTLFNVTEQKTSLKWSYDWFYPILLDNNSINTDDEEN